MLAFFMDHWDWLIAAIAGHFGISGASSLASWIKAEYAKFMTGGKSDVATLNARIAALESAVAKPVAAPIATPVASAAPTPHVGG
jgi:hypothetical protein